MKLRQISSEVQVRGIVGPFSDKYNNDPAGHNRRQPTSVSPRKQGVQFFHGKRQRCFESGVPVRNIPVCATVSMELTDGRRDSRTRRK